MDRCLVLEDNDKGSEKGSEGSSQTTNVSKEVENAVDFTPDNSQIPTELVSDGRLHIVFEVVEAEWPSLDLENSELLDLVSERSNTVGQVQIGQLEIIVRIGA